MLLVKKSATADLPQNDESRKNQELNHISMENQRAMTTLEDEILGQASYLQYIRQSKNINSMMKEVEEEREQILRSNKALFKSSNSFDLQDQFSSKDLFYQTLIESTQNGGGGTTTQQATKN